MLLIVIILVLLVGVGGGGYYGHRTWGMGGGFGIGGIVLLCLILWLLFSGPHRF